MAQTTIRVLPRLTNDYIKVEKREDGKPAGVTYVLDGHPLPLWGALVYLSYERGMEDLDAAEEYLTSLRSRRPLLDEAKT